MLLQDNYCFEVAVSVIVVWLLLLTVIVISGGRQVCSCFHQTWYSLHKEKIFWLRVEKEKTYHDKHLKLRRSWFMFFCKAPTSRAGWWVKPSQGKSDRTRRERRPGLRLRTGSTGLAGRRDVDYGAGTRPVTAQSTPDHRAGWRRLWAEMRALWERFFEKWSTRLASSGWQPSGPKWATCATRRPYWPSLWSSSYVPSTPQKVIFKNTFSLTSWVVQMLELRLIFVWMKDCWCLTKLCGKVLEFLPRWEFANWVWPTPAQTLTFSQHHQQRSLCRLLSFTQLQDGFLTGLPQKWPSMKG